MLFLFAGPQAPGEIELQTRTSSTLTFDWVPTNGYLDAYVITYSPRGGSPDDVVNVQVPFTQSRITLDDLLPATDYDISVVSVAGLNEDNEIMSESSDTVFRTSRLICFALIEKF